MDIMGMIKNLTKGNPQTMQKVQQAMQLKNNFSNDKKGVFEAINKMGLNNDQLKKAYGLLDNQKVQGMLNQFGVDVNQVKQMGAEVLNGTNNTKNNTNSNLNLDKFKKGLK